MSNVLLLEDDLVLSSQIMRSLSVKHQVSHARTLHQMKQCLRSSKFDALLLDRMVADGDSLQHLEWIREATPATKVMMLSRRCEVEERISSLRSGADDYLPKPLSIIELEVKLSKLLLLERRPVEDQLQVGQLQLYINSGEVVWRDKRMVLRRKEVEFLRCLMIYKNRVVSRQRLIEYVWGGSGSPETETVDVYVRRLRVHLGSPHPIRTARGFGYIIREPDAVYR